MTAEKPLRKCADPIRKRRLVGVEFAIEPNHQPRAAFQHVSGAKGDDAFGRSESGPAKKQDVHRKCDHEIDRNVSSSRTLFSDRSRKTAKGSG